jgi:hypothetical protein
VPNQGRKFITSSFCTACLVPDIWASAHLQTCPQPEKEMSLQGKFFIEGVVNPLATRGSGIFTDGSFDIFFFQAGTLFVTCILSFFPLY